MKNSAKYFLMRNHFILRLENETELALLPNWIQHEIIDRSPMDQDTANSRVLIFRDQIVTREEFEDVNRLEIKLSL